MCSCELVLRQRQHREGALRYALEGPTVVPLKTRCGILRHAASHSGGARLQRAKASPRSVHWMIGCRCKALPACLGRPRAMGTPSLQLKARERPHARWSEQGDHYILHVSSWHSASSTASLGSMFCVDFFTKVESLSFSIFVGYVRPFSMRMFKDRSHLKERLDFLREWTVQAVNFLAPAGGSRSSLSHSLSWLRSHLPPPPEKSTKIIRPEYFYVILGGGYG